MKPNEMPNSLLFALRLTEVSRWGIVAISRQQSVGEHCFRVTMIALAMYDYMNNETPHNSFERVDLASFAMTHDILEVLSGDLDSVFKIAMEARFPGVYNQVVTDMAQGRRDTSKLAVELGNRERAAKGTIIEAITKLADMIEALVYLETYGTNNRHSQHVRDNILERMWLKFEGFKANPDLSRYDWPRVERFINLVLDTPGLHRKEVPNETVAG